MSNATLLEISCTGSLIFCRPISSEIYSSHTPSSLNRRNTIIDKKYILVGRFVLRENEFTHNQYNVFNLKDLNDLDFEIIVEKWGNISRIIERT